MLAKSNTTPPSYEDRIAAFVRELALFAKARGNHVQWTSRVLQNVQVSSEARALQIVDRVFDDDALRKEIEATDRALQEQRLNRTVWKWFAAVRDNVSIFTNGYRDLMGRTAAVMDPASRIVDYGTGTGNIAVLLKFLQPARQVTGLDISPDNIGLAKDKMRHFGGHGDQDRLYVADLTRAEQSDTMTEGADGAVTINVNYALPSGARRFFIKRIYDDLVPGGVLVFNDPVVVSSDRAHMRRFVRGVASDAVHNESPMTEFDLAWMAYFNGVKVGETAGHTLSTATQLIDHVRSADFELMDCRKSYYDMNVFLSLRKPS